MIAKTTNRKQRRKLVVGGVGNVGRALALALAANAQAGNAPPFRAALVDFDTVEAGDVKKGFDREALGLNKAAAVIGQIRRRCSEAVARSFLPIPAAIQSVPGVVRGTDFVFNCTDSALDAAFLSELAVNSRELRLSTGILGNLAAHTLEYLGPGVTLAEQSYDREAFRDSARHHCRFGIPINSFQGVPQPFGELTAALAAQIFLNPPEAASGPYFIIRVLGSKVSQVWGERRKAAKVSSTQLEISYRSSLRELFVAAAGRMAAPASALRLNFPVPLVRRQCAVSGHGGYEGFERWPARERNCPVCGRPTLCATAPHEVSLEEVPSLADQSLQTLFAPAGLPFTAGTSAGQKRHFHLPFRLEDAPGGLGIENQEGLGEATFPRPSKDEVGT